MANLTLSPAGWEGIVDVLKSPDAFLEWIRNNVNVNRVIKQFHTNGDVFPGMAVISDIDGKAHPYDINNPSHVDKYAGVVEGRNAANVVAVITHGVLYNATLTWQQGVPYYIASNGYVIPSVPPNPRLVAVGVDSNRLLVMPAFGGTSSGGNTGIDEIDGGFANSVYLTVQQVDGGGA